MVSEGPAGAVIVYQVPVTEAWRRGQFNQKVFGNSTTSQGRWYWRPGILETIPHWHPNRGVLVMARMDAPRVVKEMRRWGGRAEWWEITLRAKDQKRLRIPKHPHR